ncbi:hypothetical protein F511_42196 [Dorcoceras hygrometricum]|uniref:Uncharacterized protein n=1 Tax=Dorcoceras hygrometricum TaxID=472368 RepID=A0A2Z7D8H3_9LAMI|nr:hypothetical protein F511_42196 [Dorcoceras hygrometricum]
MLIMTSMELFSVHYLPRDLNVSNENTVTQSMLELMSRGLKVMYNQHSLVDAQMDDVDQGRENLIKEPQQLDAYDGEVEGCCSGRMNQLERKPAEKPAQRNDLLHVMNKLAQSSSRAGNNRTRAAQEQMRREL